MKGVFFLSPFIYPYLSCKDVSPGGAELQQYLFGDALLKQGVDVHFLTGDYGQADFEEIKGFRVWKVFDKPGVKHNIANTLTELRRLNRILRRFRGYVCYVRANPFVYVQAGLSMPPLRLVFACGSDANVNIHPFRLRRPVRELYRFFVREAYRVLVQTQYQRSRCMEVFGVNAHVVPNIFPPVKVQDGGRKRGLLWVGNLTPVKRPMLFLRLVERMGVSATMIGVPAHDYPGLAREVEEHASRLANLQFIKGVPYSSIHRYFLSHRILVNTSEWEGFPNTFLQAWGSGIPVVSLGVDPDGVIVRRGCGFVARNLDEMCYALDSLLSNGKLMQEMGENGKRYVMEMHSPDRVVRMFLEAVG